MEPPRTQADLNFSLFGIPVRVHPFFWLVGLLLGLDGSNNEPKRMVGWLVALFVSILVHELGHAFAARRYGHRPWITLHSFGGLASYDAIDQNAQEKIVISFAGPLAGFMLAGLLVAGIAVSGHLIGFELSFFPVRFVPFLTQAGDSAYAPLDLMIYDLMFINIFWGLINLFPVYPLDGGQIAREILVERSPYEGVRQSLQLSIGSAIGLTVFALVNGSIYMAFLFGYLAYLSYATLKSYTGRGGPW